MHDSTFTLHDGYPMNSNRCYEDRQGVWSSRVVSICGMASDEIIRSRGEDQLSVADGPMRAELSGKIQLGEHEAAA